MKRDCTGAGLAGMSYRTSPVITATSPNSRTLVSSGCAEGTVPPEVAKTLGNYPELGKKAAAAIPDAKLVELDDVGHLPHIEAFQRFFPPLLEFLEAK